MVAMSESLAEGVAKSVAVGLPPLSEGVALDPALCSFMESCFGVGFGDVRIHTGPWAAAAARALGARAFTFGSEIVFGKGEFLPESPEGRRLLAHELVHVVQQ